VLELHAGEKNGVVSLLNMLIKGVDFFVRVCAMCTTDVLALSGHVHGLIDMT